jgi:hypothetical protein
MLPALSRVAEKGGDRERGERKRDRERHRRGKDREIESEVHTSDLASAASARAGLRR